jgi:hypothetical protein
VVGFVIEELHDCPPGLVFAPLTGPTVTQGLVEVRLYERCRPSEDRRIGLLALGPKLVELGEELLIEARMPGAMKPSSGTTPVRRLSQTRSPTMMWFSMPWMDLKKAPRSRFRSSSLRVPPKRTASRSSSGCSAPSHDSYRAS